MGFWKTKKSRTIFFFRGTLGMVEITIEIVEFPIENGGSFHRYVNVYQRVTLVMSGMFVGLIHF